MDAIVDHQGKGINSVFQILWKAGDRTWAPYREVAHLMAMERYCELMGVGDPHDLPVKRDRAERDEGDVALSSARVLVERFKGSGHGEGSVTYSPMSQPQPHLSHDELIACATYARQHRDHSLGLCAAPTGPPPPGYDSYLRLLSIQGHPTGVHYSQPPPPVQYQSPSPAATITMPSDAFSHFLKTQVQSMEIATNSGRYRAKEDRSRNRPQYYTRGRGLVRGGHRGSRGRDIPGGLGFNRRARPSNRLAEVPVPSTSRLAGREARWRMADNSGDEDTTTEADTTTTEADTNAGAGMSIDSVSDAGVINVDPLSSITNNRFPGVGNLTMEDVEDMWRIVSKDQTGGDGNNGPTANE